MIGSCTETTNSYGSDSSGELNYIWLKLTSPILFLFYTGKKNVRLSFYYVTFLQIPHINVVKVIVRKISVHFGQNMNFIVKAVTGNACSLSAQRDSGAAGWEQDAVRPSRRTDLTGRNRSSILCFLQLDVQVRTAN